MTILVDRIAEQPDDFTSSNVDVVGYDADTETLYIEFQSGLNVYSYEGVKESTYDMLVNADSVGSFYSKHIKGEFTSNLVGEDAIELRERDTSFPVGSRVLITHTTFPEWNGPGTVVEDGEADGTGIYIVNSDAMGREGGFGKDYLSPLTDEVDLKPDTKWASVPEGETPKFALGGSTGPSISISASGISIGTIGVKSKFGVTWTNGTLTFEPTFEAMNEADALRQFNQAVAQVMPDADVKIKAVTHYFE